MPPSGSKTLALTMLLLAACVAMCQAAYWLEGINHNGLATYQTSPSTYKVFRNVKDFGAKGDGVTDDTDAINNAISSGNRCALGCDSSTTSPALVYFPAGTYVVSRPIIAYYFSQLVGDPNNKPVLKAAANFAGIAVVDSDPYLAGGANWYGNTNNFYRGVRNFVIDLRATASGTGIHWQVAQATQLQNIVFEMAGTQSQGIFMDNGSGGFMSDLTFNGGRIGAFLGNQQFTSRNLVFNGCDTAVIMNWNWLWTFKSLSINNCQVGVDMRNQGVGSIVILDSSITNTPIGIVVPTNGNTNPRAANTLTIDNLVTNNVPQIVATPTGTTLRAGSTGAVTVAGWAKGRSIDYTTGAAVESTVQGDFTPPQKPAVLLNNGKVFERSRPQYENLAASQFVSARASGAKGDGVTDDTAALQNLFSANANTGKVIFLDHGFYKVTSTLTIRPGTRITGEVWANIVASGSFFSDPSNPQPLLRVGLPGDTGVIELSDLAVMTQGPAGGAILIEWNNADPAGQQGVSGMWEVHARVGGSAGSNLQADKCSKNPTGSATPDPACMAAFMLMRVGKTGGVYLENNWFWTSDHELDQASHNQVTLYAGRGFWSESTNGPVWMWGTASEHNVLYQYQFTNTKNVFMGAIQTETPYYQSHPGVQVPFTVNSAFSDPQINCASGDLGCSKSWGLRVLNSKDILVAGAGLYSFFENWGQDCLKTSPQTCQTRMTSIEGSSSNVVVYSMNTVGTTKMMTVDGVDAGSQSTFTNNTFTHTAVLINAKSSSAVVPTSSPTSTPTPTPTSTTVTPSPGSCSAVEQNVDYIGNDIGQGASSSVSGCCALCANFSGCKAYSWLSGTCYFKSTKNQTASKSGVASGTVDTTSTPAPTPAPTCKLEAGIDYVGNDISNTPSTAASGCCSICANTSGCKAFSWLNGNCYLKSAKGSTSTNSAVTSGTV
ncbi:hypothetical protein Poli38472_009825 [Pythium oligandrum]|uniref:Apple domain-containing protein n=1 Tax=Pythium oligandrum TaxID=41045 RepID=A0A8K1CFF1_PYTOL|nr:hypothetical protein Poli38472_009825 [Pythium oligandrum]|eukprot:TMW62332.1 hypothetical protein Poli38472_009825 [Pythium oligandrum]